MAADDSIGGQLYYSAGLSTISDLPLKAHWPVKMHAWVNAGRLDEVDQSSFYYLAFTIFCLFKTEKPLKDAILHSVSRPSISAGVGLIYRFDPIRVEVNFGVPLVASKSDGAKRGLQVGMGLEFM
jgi:outer membrane protein insertion porin family